jgi:hypothetical protein
VKSPIWDPPRQNSNGNLEKRGVTVLKKLAVATVILALILPATALTDEGAALAELVVRPLGFVGFVVGSTIFLVTLPVSMVVGGTDEMAETLVKKPYRFTFQRDMGEGLLYSDHDSEQ